MSKKKKQKKLKKYLRKIKSNALEKMLALSVYPEFLDYTTYVAFANFAKEHANMVSVSGDYPTSVIRQIIAPRMYGSWIDEKCYPVNIYYKGFGEEKEIKLISYQVIIDLSAMGYKDIVFQVLVRYNGVAKPGDWLYKFIAVEDPDECYYGEAVEPVFTVYAPVSDE